MTYVQDLWNRADGVAADAKWSKPASSTGDVTIASNQVVPSLANTGCTLYYVERTLGGNQFSRIKYISGISNGIIELYVRGRQYGSAITEDNYKLQINGFGGPVWKILRLDDGVESADLVGSSITLVGNDVIMLGAVGTVLTAYQNGSVLGSYDTNPDGTKYSIGDVGFKIYSFAGGLICDDWAGGDDIEPRMPPIQAGGFQVRAAI